MPLSGWGVLPKVSMMAQELDRMLKTLEEYEAIADEIEATNSYPKGVQKILDVLSDGRWHTNRDIIKRSGQVHITARILEARRIGFRIE